ncbi:Hypothetical protein A7982_11466 [Minicystis rosea]|nr:Hypothetical protein A7982_11466 [Minicystis rosea]
MKLTHLAATGIRGVPDGTYAFTDPRSGTPLPVVLVTGGPASGKTSLLEAIAAAKEAIGSYGTPPDPKRLVRSEARESRLVTTWLLSDAERDHTRLDDARQTVRWELSAGASRCDAEPGLRRLFAEHSCAPSRSKLEYFPANRVLGSSPHPAFGGPSREAETRLRAIRAADKYASLVEGVRAAALAEAVRAAQDLRESGVALRSGEPGPLSVYEAAVAAVVPDLRLQGGAMSGGKGPRFLRRTREEMSLEDLSESERHGILFALAFAHFGLHGSLVLIDEPELHIHASARVRFLHALVGLGRDNQIIAATGATELVAAASPGQVIDLSARATAKAP